MSASRVAACVAFCSVFGLGLAAVIAAPAKKPATPKKPEPKIEVPARRQEIAKVDTDVEARNRVKFAAKRIDDLIEANYTKHKVQPNEHASDEVFLRRVYLDITGRIPTLQQAKSFLGQKTADRRARLIDALLNTEGYSSHFYNYWADLLRVKDDRLTNDVPGRPYAEWLKVNLETNRPYNELVFEMLTAEGKVWENPAAGYALRDFGMPLDHVNNSIRIFLGTQIGCAQCHDHPFDRWTRKEFYEIAAFSSGLNFRRGGKDKKFGGKEDVVANLRKELTEVDSDFRGAGDGKYNRFFNGNLREIWESNNALKFPHDYQYDNAKPKDVVQAQTIFGPKMKPVKGESPRVTFAKWVTSSENPRFARTIANRLWKQVFGVGQFDPVDDLKDDSIAENPELMAYLESEMVRLKFDMKEFLRILLNTQVYQRESSAHEPNLVDGYHFPGPVLRRMTAEQAWDSFITLAVFNPDEYQSEPARVQAEFLNVDLASISAEELYRRDKTLREITNNKHREAREKDHRYKNLLLVRASELPTPLPASHFLRQFGQSDRESIAGGHTDSSVPQVLQMFNSPVTHMLMEPKALMASNVMSEKSDEARVGAIFLSILARKPTDTQQRAALEEIRKHGSAGYGNVIWSLVNTREFMFVQ